MQLLWVFLDKILKYFLDWFNKKPKLNNSNHRPPFVEEGQIWWCHFGQNIGTEINGKSKDFTRPAIIFTKFSKYAFFVIPTKIKIKNGSWFSSFEFKNTKMTAVLSQTRIIDYRRLQNKIGILDEQDFIKITNDFQNLHAKKITLRG